MKDQPRTLGRLREAGGRPESVKDEMRRNLLQTLSRRERSFEGIHGYDRTVVPQIVNAILARHDILLLGLRGQAKTRLARRFRSCSTSMYRSCAVRRSTTTPTRR